MRLPRTITFDNPADTLPVYTRRGLLRFTVSQLEAMHRHVIEAERRECHENGLTQSGIHLSIYRYQIGDALRIAQTMRN